MKRHNTYWLLRHGRSRPNEAGLIVSSLEHGVKPEHGLSEAGREQAAAAGRQLALQLAAAGVHSLRDDVVVYCSPFSRARETAALAAEAAGLDAAASSIRVTPALRERFFGAALELTSHDNYCPFWACDEADAGGRPLGAEDGESVADVSARLAELLQELEQRHQHHHILLVSHGDTLSILQATLLGTPLTQHRQYGLDTAGLRAVHPHEVGAAGADGAAAAGQQASGPVLAAAGAQ